MLDATGLRELLDGVVTSAEVGVAKPARGALRGGARARRRGAGEALHVGDSLEEDVEGAPRAGIAAGLAAARGADAARRPPACRVIAALDELVPVA